MSHNPSPNPDSVTDEASFLAFVQELADDRKLAAHIDDGPFGAPRSWQNHTIETFLEAALSWAQDSDFGRSQDLPENASVWRRVAVFLYCGKIYE